MIKEGESSIVLPMPALSFAEAVERVPAFDAPEKDTLLPTGHTRLFHHGGPTERVAVLFHGITNNPLQWEAFGQSLFADGWNVLIPRLPYHGLRNLLTTLPGRLDAATMIRYITESVQIAHGLGQNVAVVGLSAGGVYAAWAAQEFLIARVVVIAPLFALPHIPPPVMPVVTGLFRHLPNQMWWWNPREKANHIPPHAYPKYSTRNLAETLYLGEWVARTARTTPPRCTDIRIMSNASDRSVSNAATDCVADDWKRHGATVRMHLFARSDGLPHDVIDLTQPRGKPELVYAQLREMLDAGR